MTDEERLEVAEALSEHLLPAERVLAAAPLHDPTSPWRQTVVMSEHRFARVALLDGHEPKVVVVPYAAVASSSWTPVEFWTVDGAHIYFGQLADPSGVDALERAMWDLALPDIDGGNPDG